MQVLCRVWMGGCVGGLLKQYGWLFQLLFLMFLSYFLAKITNVYLATLLEVPRSIAVVSDASEVELESAIGPISSYKVIVQRNVFDASEAEGPAPCEKDDERPECKKEAEEQQVVKRPPGEAVKTSLKLTIHGVVMIGDGKDGRSTAQIEGGKGTKGPDVYAVGDAKKTFHPEAVLVQIKLNRIEFLNKGRLEYAEMAEDLGASIFVPPDKLKGGGDEGKTVATASDGVPTGDQVSKVQDGKYVVNQAEIDAALANLDKLYTQIRAVPNFEGGKVKGMKILSIKPGSLFSKLGLRRGDVLDQINGQQLDIKSGFQLFNQLKEQKTFSLDLKRGGKDESFEYEIR
jgi:general secretion pathway protein C